MQDFFFYLFSILACLSAFVMVCSRNAVNAAMFMIVSLVSVAGLFIELNAFFLAALQVLVYAGAVMVLFLFIIMLLDVHKAGSRPLNKSTLMASGVGAILLALSLATAVMNQQALPAVDPDTAGSSVERALTFTTSLDAYGYGLFSKYMLPFQVVGVLLLVAIIGVLVISKRNNADETK